MALCNIPSYAPNHSYRLGNGICSITKLDYHFTRFGQMKPMSSRTTNYALSKYTQELIGLNLGQRYHIPTVCMRYSIVQGARQSFRNAYSGILRIFTQQLLANQAPLCYEDGQQLRDYVAVQDVAAANCLVLADARADFEVFNVGGNRQVTVLEYAQLLADRVNRSLMVRIPGYYRFGDTRHVFSDIQKLNALGWSPMRSLPEIMDDYLNWATHEPDFGNYSQQAQREMQALGTLRPSHSQFKLDPIEL
jgi:dTDP-L-rhamnose 4-epimerase